MERLPRDIACERLHNDIVRLLDEHVPRSPQMVNVVANNQMLSKYPSPTGHMLQQPTVIVSKRQKSKRPSKNAGPTSPQEGAEASLGGSIKRKASVKRNNNNNSKKSTQQMSEVPPQSADSIGSSPVESPMTNLPSPYDTTTLYSNMGLTLESLMAAQLRRRGKKHAAVRHRQLRGAKLDFSAGLDDAAEAVAEHPQPTLLEPESSAFGPEQHVFVTARLQRVPFAGQNAPISAHQPHSHSGDAGRNPAEAWGRASSPDSAHGLRFQPDGD
ncbi:hypothetical protein D910_09376 [Dendroctonus ponderosae]|uniref:Uncharacterized protein n=1 Tax=Dendroctonus ponderosae TaxID=77166 RepID=U4UDK4_DENPD|nr:hypothetical protein D910_09376 [Dendroctonus ponderosae]